MPARLSAFVIWGLVAASVAFWGLRLLVRSPQAPIHTVAVGDEPVARGDVSRLLGAPPVESVASTAATSPQLSARFRLTGVMAPKVPSAQGVALIAVDGKLPRAFKVGASVDGELVLQGVSLRTASIGPAQGAPAVVLELPPLPPPATGTLPPNPAAIAPAARVEPVPRSVPPRAPPSGMVRRMPGQAQVQ